MSKRKLFREQDELEEQEILASQANQAKRDAMQEALDYFFEALKALYKAGADIPRPLASTEHAILMEYVGDRRQAAPPLQYVQLSRGEARQVFDQLMDNVELWLAHNYIHADLSAYNVLY